MRSCETAQNKQTNHIHVWMCETCMCASYVFIYVTDWYKMTLVCCVSTSCALFISLFLKEEKTIKLTYINCSRSFFRFISSENCSTSIPAAMVDHEFRKNVCAIPPIKPSVCLYFTPTINEHIESQ